MSQQVTVLASRWSGGWELEINEDEHTQVRDLGRARQQVIDYLDTMYEDIDHSDWDITVIPEIGELAAEVEASKEASRQAEEARTRDAQRSRAAVRSLLEAGYTIADAAAILGVPHGRVSRLARS